MLGYTLALSAPLTRQSGGIPSDFWDFFAFIHNFRNGGVTGATLLVFIEVLVIQVDQMGC